MAFVKLDLNNIKEPEAAPEGEYDIRIMKVVDTESKKGNPMTVFSIRVEDAGPDVSMFQHYIVYPDQDTPPDQKQMRLLDIKRFLQLFGQDTNLGGFDPSDLQGSGARAFLQQEEDDKGVIRNRIRLPRLRE
jgi:hypothetical protein